MRTNYCRIIISWIKYIKVLNPSDLHEAKRRASYYALTQLTKRCFSMLNIMVMTHEKEIQISSDTMEQSRKSW